MPQESRIQKEKNTFLAFEFQNPGPVGVGRTGYNSGFGKRKGAKASYLLLPQRAEASSGWREKERQKRRAERQETSCLDKDNLGPCFLSGLSAGSKA